MTTINDTIKAEAIKHYTYFHQEPELSFKDPALYNNPEKTEFAIQSLRTLFWAQTENCTFRNSVLI